MNENNNAESTTPLEMGLILINSGRFNEAKQLLTHLCNQEPDNAEAWNMLGYIKGRLGNFNEAGECCRRVLALQPDHSEAHMTMGNVLLMQGKHEEAAENYQAAIRINPNLPIAYYNLGNLRILQEQYSKAVNNYLRAIALRLTDAQLATVKEQGKLLLKMNRLEDAKALFTHLCQANPTDAEAWHNASIIHGRLGEIDDAGECCRRVLALQPDHSEALTNLGHIFFNHGQFDDSVMQYQKALDIDPKNLSALNNMGKACQTNEHFLTYLAQYQKTLPLLDNSLEARSIFWSVAKDHHISKFDPWLYDELQEYIEMPNANGELVSSIAARFIKLKYNIQASTIDDNADLQSLCGQLASDKLFLCMFERLVNTDADLELLLTRLRYALLLHYYRDLHLGISETRIVLALARQGINNEYVFSVDPEEETRIFNLRQEIERTALFSPIPTHDLEEKLSIFGMYEPLSSLACKQHLSKYPLDEFSETFRPFFEEAIINPLQEEEIKKDIVSLGKIADSTSSLVQSQYEDNPYPRWLSIPLTRKRNLGLVLRQLFPWFTPPSFLDGPIRILVAGCGTGKHPIYIALSYSNADVLAVDISKSSLSYAIRMSRKYGVNNIEYMQGDILELAKLNRRFHIIECGGVLHHLQDPFAGWKVLTDLLIDDGLMSIGLYSELARKWIIEARDVIKREVLAPDINSLRNFRARIQRREFGNRMFAHLSNSYDFFNTSGCRDLLFHYQEHRYTLPQLSKELNDLNLDFLGFTFGNAKSISTYRERFPEDKDMRDLQLWDLFEKAHPNTFGGMYKFWCQKKNNN